MAFKANTRTIMNAQLTSKGDMNLCVMAILLLSKKHLPVIIAEKIPNFVHLSTQFKLLLQSSKYVIAYILTKANAVLYIKFEKKIHVPPRCFRTCKINLKDTLPISRSSAKKSFSICWFSRLIYPDSSFNILNSS